MERGSEDGSWTGMLRRAAAEFMEDGCPSLAAALAYYTVFSLPPLLVLLVWLASLFWGADATRHAIEGQFGRLIGESAGQEIHAILENARRPGGGNPLAGALGVAALLFGATGAFIQLQSSLNQAWEVQPDPKQGGVRNFLFKRVFSFGMILVIGFLLLVSLAVSAGLAAIGDRMGSVLPQGFSAPLLMALNAAASFAVITVLFAAIYRILPDARVEWRDVWSGSVATALLFTAGKFVLGYYLGHSDPGQAFGAASAVAVLLLWTYYSGLILLFGAEFTQQWALERGSGIRPQPGAVRVVEERRRVSASAPPERRPARGSET